MFDRRLWAAYLIVTAASCGSVGGGLKTDAGGGTGGNGSAGSSDAAADRSAGSGGGTGTGGVAGVGGGIGGSIDAGPADAVTDGGGLPVSCQQIKQQTPAAATGVFTIAPLGAAQSVFCEMSVDGGGWTAFYVGDNGSTPGGASFETAADLCTDPPNRCLRRLPPTIDATHDFAVKCGAAVVKFKMPATAVDYFANGLQHMWLPLTSAVTIDLVSVGKANLVANVWTGQDGVGNAGWIIAGSTTVTTTTFGNSYATNASWNFCNGAADSSSRVMLFYR